MKKKKGKQGYIFLVNISNNNLEVIYLEKSTLSLLHAKQLFFKRLDPCKLERPI